MSNLFNPNEALISRFVTELRDGYHKTYGGMNPNIADIIAWAARSVCEIICNSDALYHNVEHTILVTLVGQEILRGKHIREGGVSCEDWLHFIISLLCHDIGYVKGVCRKDNPEEGKYATGVGEEMIHLNAGCTDASLTPYHVDRGKLFIFERFGKHGFINAQKIMDNIQCTRFPVPSTKDAQLTHNFPGLVRAADLIGQLGDPRYLQKVAALFYEFEETGTNAHLGYKTPGDLRKNYHKFFWAHVWQYIQHACSYLNVTNEGKVFLASLYSNVFTVEHTTTISQSLQQIISNEKK